MSITQRVSLPRLKLWACQCGEPCVIYKINVVLTLATIRRVAHLSDIPYVLNNQHLGGGADNSPAQLELGKTMSRSILKFVTEGDPTGSPGGLTEWPGAFEGISKKEIKQNSTPSKFSLQIFGGPYGTQPVTVDKEARSKLSDAGQAVAAEKLFERCEFINSDTVREEIGV